MHIIAILSEDEDLWSRSGSPEQNFTVYFEQTMKLTMDQYFCYYYSQYLLNNKRGASILLVDKVQCPSVSSLSVL